MEKPHEIRVVIADDHPIFRQGLRQVLEAGAGITVVGEAADGVSAIALIDSLKPDVAILDIDMPVKNGFAVAKHIHDEQSQTASIFLTMYREGDALNRALEFGVRGYVLKDGAVGEIVSAVKAVAAGKHHLSPALSGLLVDRMARLSALTEGHPGLKSLTPTERRVLVLIAEKKTTKQIAADLFVSPRTIDNHRASICAKLDLQGSNALLKFALEHKADLL